MRERRVRGIVPCLGSAASSLGIFHLHSRRHARRGASALCLPPGIWHVYAEAPRASPEAPLLLAAPPDQPLAQAHQCGDRRFVLPRMPGRRAKAPRLKWPRCAGDPGLGGPIWGAPRAEGSRPKGSVSAGGVCPESSGCLRRDRPVPLHTCPPRSGFLLRCRSPGPRGGAGRGGSFRLLVPDLDPGGESLGDKAWEGRGREGSLNPSYFPPTAHLTPRPTPTLGAGRSAEDPENPSVLSCTCDSKQGGKRSPGLCLLHLSPPPPPPSIT